MMSEKITVAENAFYKLWVYPKKKVIHHEMLAPVSGETFKSLLLTGVDAMKKHSATKWLSDDRLNGPLLPEDMKWGNDVWFPMTQKCGWTTWAMVMPEAIIGHVAMKNLVADYAKRGVLTALFADPDDAMTWLDEQP